MTSVCSSLGSTATVTSAQVNTIDPTTLDVLVEYRDYSNVTCFLPPTYPASGPAYGPTCVVSQSCPTTFRLTRVPIASPVTFTVRGRGPSSTFVCATVTIETPSTYILQYYPPFGATCVTLRWTSVFPVPTPFAYFDAKLFAEPSGAQVGSAVVPGIDGVGSYTYTFSGLEPGGSYTAQVTGLLTLNAYPEVLGVLQGIVTPDLFTLGTSAALSDVSLLTVGEAQTYTLSLLYTDFSCIDADSLTLTFQGPSTVDPPPTIDRVIPDPPTGVAWLISNLPAVSPPDNEFFFTVTGTPSSTPECRVCEPGPPGLGDPISTSATIKVVTGEVPTTPCADTVIAINTHVVAPTCVQVSFSSQPTLLNGYTWQIGPQDQSNVSYQGGVILYDASGLSSFQFLISDLTPATPYLVQVQGTCIDGGQTLAAPLHVTTIPRPTLKSTGYSVNSQGTVTVTCSSLPSCYSTPTLSYVPGKSKQYKISQTAPLYTIANVPPGTTLYLQFSAEVSICPDADTLLSPPFTVTVPALPTPCSDASIVLQQSTTTPTCVTVTWNTTNASVLTGPYFVTLVSESKVLLGTVFVPLSSTKTATFDGLDPDTTYTVSVQAKCAGASSKPVIGQLDVRTSPALTGKLANVPPPVNLENVIFAGGAASGTISYSGGTCVENVTLEWVDGGTSPHPTVTPGPGKYTLSLLRPGTTYTYKFTGTVVGLLPDTCSACAGVTNPGATVYSNTFTFTVPEGPSPPPAPNADLFDLHIPMYSMPSRIASVKVQAASAEDSVLYGYGTVNDYGSYANLTALQRQFAYQLVDKFIKYRMQSLQTVTLSPWSWGVEPKTVSLYTPIAAVYYCVNGDPTVQGAALPTTTAPYEANLTYSFASSNPEYAAAASPLPGFAQPPILQFFYKMVQYNYEMYKDQHPYKKLVQLGLTCYGSKKSEDNGEQWYSNAGVLEDGTINVNTNEFPTSNPELVPSLVDGTACDGNGSATHRTAGWNCMERWFAYAAYLNQCLRQYIDGGNITAGEFTMTLNDITSDTCKFFQISAITCDGEGNGFPNTMYPDDPSVTPEWCNWAINMLWYKWFNQTTTVEAAPSPPSESFPSPAWQSFYETQGSAGSGGLAVAPRAVVATEFTIPAAFSMTTPGLIKNMSSADVGSTGFNSVNLVFNEVYDTFQMPYPWLAADTTPTVLCGSSSPVAGQAFTDAVYEAAHPTSATDPLVTDPASFSGGFWDNCNLPSSVCPNALNINDSSVPPTLAPSEAPSISGGVTIFNSSQQLGSALMNTSRFNPWSDASTSCPWILTKSTVPTSANAVALGWALEGSRYDLYNGFWAAATKPSTATSVDYTTVKQGTTFKYRGCSGMVDGGLLWEDLTTGLKPKVGLILAGLKTGSQSATPANATGQVFMLSIESGPFSNCQGVEASARQVPPGPPVPIQDRTLLTFSCPDAALQARGATKAWPGWPGWLGMAGQYWGPISPEYAGIAYRYTVSQTDLAAVPPTAEYNPPAPDPSPFVSVNNGTEDNFGVYSDFGILLAAYIAMAYDLNGTTSKMGPFAFGTSDTYRPRFGMYELGFIPMSWLQQVPSDS